MPAACVTPRYNSRLKYPNKIALIQFDTPKPSLASCKFPIDVTFDVAMPIQFIYTRTNPCAPIE